MSGDAEYSINEEDKRRDGPMFSMMSMRELERYLDENPGRRNFVLLDVRSMDEFSDGHLRGAVNIPMEELEHRFWELRRDRWIIVYCEHGSKSLMAARLLDQMGYRVTAAAGGLVSYRGRWLRTE